MDYSTALLFLRYFFCLSVSTHYLVIYVQDIDWLDIRVHVFQQPECINFMTEFHLSIFSAVGCGVFMNSNLQYLILYLDFVVKLSYFCTCWIEMLYHWNFDIEIGWF